MRIPFDIKYRQQIESGEYKVETESGAPAKILDWEWNNEHTGVCLAVKITEKGKDTGYLYTEYGKRASLFPYGKDSDLFIVTPEPEPTEWQRFISACLQKYGLLDCGAADRIAKKSATELLELARKELLSEKMLIEQTYNPDINKAHELGRKEGIIVGKAEALKDLPRWRKDFEFMGVREPEIVGPWLCYKKNRIVITDLEKLPGFKEDSHE